MQALREVSNHPSAVLDDSREPTTKAEFSKTQAFALTGEHLKRIASAADKVVSKHPNWKQYALKE